MSHELKKWKKNCPNCGNEQVYKSKRDLQYALRRNKICKRCANKHRSTGEKNGMYGKNHSIETIEKIKKKRKEQIFTEETRKKMSKFHKERCENYNHWNGRTHTEISKEKMRKKAAERLIDNGWHPSYNKKACDVIKEYGVRHGYNFRTAEHETGEYYIEKLGYWVDGYDETNNVVIEYYEKDHKYQVEKDMIRQKAIEDYLGCKFIVIWE